VEKYDTARQVTHDNIIRRKRITCWINRATDTLRICNTAFPRQQWWRERPSMLRLPVWFCTSHRYWRFNQM